MDIKPINYNVNSPAFGAVVNIEANRTLLDKKSMKELIEIGRKIGDDNTKIDMFVSYSKDNPYVYKFSHKTECAFKENLKTEKIAFETDDEILTPTMKPVDFGKKLLARIKDFVNINTSLV